MAWRRTSARIRATESHWSARKRSRCCSCGDCLSFRFILKPTCGVLNCSLRCRLNPKGRMPFSRSLGLNVCEVEYCQRTMHSSCRMKCGQEIGTSERASHSVAHAPPKNISTVVGKTADMIQEQGARGKFDLPHSAAEPLHTVRIRGSFFLTGPFQKCRGQI